MAELDKQQVPYKKDVPVGIMIEVPSAALISDVLAREVGVQGIFSDWPATVTFYANCMGLK